MNEKQCPFCAATQGTCGCLRLLDLLMTSIAAAPEITEAACAIDYAQAIVRERVKRYGGVAK